VITVVALASVGSADLPDQVAGLDRLHTDPVQALEDQMDQVEMGDMEIDAAVYGTGDEEVLTLFRYSNLPTSPTLSLLLRNAGRGVVGSGGTVDFDAEVLVTRDGVEYNCMPFTGRLFPGDVINACGRLCAWTEGDEYLLLVDARAQGIAQAVGDAAAAHKALG
jgi:hypothetical protein